MLIIILSFRSYDTFVGRNFDCVRYTCFDIIVVWKILLNINSKLKVHHDNYTNKDVDTLKKIQSEYTRRTIRYYQSISKFSNTGFSWKLGCNEGGRGVKHYWYRQFFSIGGYFKIQSYILKEIAWICDKMTFVMKRKKLLCRSLIS